jgi:hypothetical protein
VTGYPLGLSHHPPLGRHAPLQSAPGSSTKPFPRRVARRLSESALVLLILPVVWALVLIPPWVRRWRQGRAVRSVASFHRQLSSIERSLTAPYGDLGDIAGPAHRAATRRPSRVALRRRRQVFFGLLAGFFGSLGTALWSGSVVTWVLHAGIAVAFLGYVALLVRHQQRLMERSAKLRHISPAVTSTLSPVPSSKRHYSRRPNVVVLGGSSVPSA